MPPPRTSTKSSTSGTPPRTPKGPVQISDTHRQHSHTHATLSLHHSPTSGDLIMRSCRSLTLYLQPTRFVPPNQTITSRESSRLLALCRKTTTLPRGKFATWTLTTLSLLTPWVFVDRCTLRYSYSPRGCSAVGTSRVTVSYSPLSPGSSAYMRSTDIQAPDRQTDRHQVDRHGTPAPLSTLQLVSSVTATTPITMADSLSKSCCLQR